MQTPDNARAELWWTLARAFLPPRDPAMLVALQQALPDSLAALCAEIPDTGDGAPATRHLPALVSGFAGIADGHDLLVHYSQCFLAPPIRVSLNLSPYIDGTTGGPSLDALERWMAAFDVTRTAAFPEGPDHLACVLELLGVIESTDESFAADFAHALVLPGLPGLLARFDFDDDPAIRESPYQVLMETLLTSLRSAYPRVTGDTPRRPRYRQRPPGDGWRHCARCAAPIATDKELSVIETALKREGLPVEHLRFCPECRDAVRGWTKKPLSA